MRLVEAAGGYLRLFTKITTQANVLRIVTKVSPFTGQPQLAPHLIDFGSIGSSELGFIAVAESSRNLPFEIRRVYWAYHTPHNVVRGKHAHKELKQVLFAVSGIIRVELENERGALSDFILDNPSVGLYIPEMHWRTIKFSHNAVMMCLASMEYRENDYIRNYADFKSLCKDLGY